MEKVKKIMMATVCIICMCLIVTITMKYVNPIVIERVDPVEIKVGQDFYLFEGKPTMSIYGKGFMVGDQIYINGELQDSAVGNDGWMTCFVDRALYQEAGELKVEIRRLNDSGRVKKKSDKVDINVIE